ncbi:hypothetical protein JCM18899A_55130 [Nocardioides sp. AN3]
MLLLEARDRLGGRTYSSKFPGTDVDIELGGQFVLPAVVHTNRELERYGFETGELPEPENIETILGGKRLPGTFAPLDQLHDIERAALHLIKSSLRIRPGMPLDHQDLADLDVSLEEFLAPLDHPPETYDFVANSCSGYTFMYPQEQSALTELSFVAVFGQSLVTWLMGITTRTRTGALATRIAQDVTQARLESPSRVSTRPATTWSPRSPTARPSPPLPSSSPRRVNWSRRACGAPRAIPVGRWCRYGEHWRCRRTSGRSSRWCEIHAPRPVRDRPRIAAANEMSTMTTNLTGPAFFRGVWIEEGRWDAERMVRLTPEDVRGIRTCDQVAHWAAVHPDELGLGCDRRWITFAEWHERVQERASSMRSGGVSPVALVYDAADAIDFVVSYIAAQGAERPALVLNYRLPAQALQAQIDLAGAGTVLSSGRDDIAAAAEPRHEPLLDRWGETIADISYSSGTTGDPKGILLSHRALAWAGVLVSELAFVGRTSFDQAGEPLGADDTLVSAFQAGSAATANGFLNVGLAVGARMHFLSKFDPGTFTQVMQDVQAILFYGGPAHLALWRQAEPDATPVARAYVVIGQTLSRTDASWFVERRGSAHLVNAYGLTESCAGMLVAVDEENIRDTGVIGRPVGPLDLRLVGPDGEEVDTEGELVMSCFGMMEGYLDRPDLTAEKLRDGWFRTGDIVERKGDVYYIRGRVGDRINRGGYKFDPIEVEEVATTVTGVTGAVACAIPHPVLGEDVALAIEVGAGREIADVREAVAEALARELPTFKVPRDIRAVREMPRAPLGKPQRAAVAAWFTSSECDDGEIAERS